MKEKTRNCTKGAAYSKIFTSKIFKKNSGYYFLEFELSLKKNNFLKITKYILSYIQGKPIRQKEKEVIYKIVEDHECGKIKLDDKYDWKNIEKKDNIKENPKYEIKRCKINKGDKVIYYYMVLKIEQYSTKTITTEMIYKKTVNKGI